MALSVQRTAGAASDFFFTLLELTDQGKHDLEAMPKVDRMIHDGLSRSEYETFLADLYAIVWHFCPIMGNALGRLGEGFAAVRDHLVFNIGDENGHHQFVLDDLAAIGADPRVVNTRAPHPAVRAFTAYNYDMPGRSHPSAVLGMLYTLEVVSSVYGGRTAASIARALNMDPDGPGFTFLSSHATMDQDHMARLNVVIKTIHDPTAQAAIVETANTNWWLLQQLMRE